MRYLLSLIGALTIHSAALATCPPAGFTRSELVELQAANGEVADSAKRQALAIELLACLGESDSVLREQTAFPLLMTWMRTDKLELATLQTLRVSQIAALKKYDSAGLTQPFAALVLAELVRADRTKPFMNEKEIKEIVQVGTTYLSTVRDYRGHDEKEGWRHAVPHVSDLMSQLARHQAVGKTEQKLILAAIATQLYAAGAQSPPQYYHYFEGPRMGWAVFHLAVRSDIPAAEWEAWFGAFTVTRAEQEASKPELFARYHNMRSFLMPLYISLVEAKDAAPRDRIMPFVTKAVKQF